MNIPARLIELLSLYLIAFVFLPLSRQDIHSHALDVATTWAHWFCHLMAVLFALAIVVDLWRRRKARRGLQAGLVMVALCFGLQAQTAKVVQLTQPDVDRVKSAWDAKQKADAAWQAAMTDVEHKYVSDSHQETDYGMSGSLSTIVGSSTSVIAWNGTDLRAVPVDPEEANIRQQVERSNGFTPMFGGTCLIQYGDLDIPSKDPRMCRAAEQVQKERADADKERERIKALPKKTVYTPRPGWQNGFDFSEGFQFVVPKPEPPQTPNRYPSLLMNNLSSDSVAPVSGLQFNGPATLKGLNGWTTGATETLGTIHGDIWDLGPCGHAAIQIPSEPHSITPEVGDYPAVVEGDACNTPGAHAIGYSECVIPAK